MDAGAGKNALPARDIWGQGAEMDLALTTPAKPWIPSQSKVPPTRPAHEKRREQVAVG